MKPITQAQADALVKWYGYSYSELRTWTCEYASKVIGSKRKPKPEKKNPQLTLSL